MNRDYLARALFEKAHLRGEFVLRSGRVATEYFDKYRFESDPRLLRAVAEALAPLVPTDVDALAGLELGGVPIATALGLALDLPVRFVRKVAKPYGTGNLAEGGEIDGLRLLVVEDVVTSGGQILASVEALRDLGALVDRALCVVDREVGGKEALNAVGIALQPLFTMSDLTFAAQSTVPARDGT